MVKPSDVPIEPCDRVGSEKTELETAAPPMASPKVRLDSEMEFTVCEVAGVTVIRAAHGGTGKHFQFGAAEHHVAMLLDGERSTTEIITQAKRDGLDWSAEDIADFISV
ncbi:MAG: peptidase M50, partial [Rhodopirellula sp. JB055]